MRVTDIEVPKGVDRLSSADFRLLLANHMQQGGTTSPSSKGQVQGKGRGKYSQKVLASLPDRMRADQLQSIPEPADSEHQEQVELVQWLRLMEIRHFAIPNGGHRHLSVAKQLAAEGVMPGVSDLVILPEAGAETVLPIVFLEMKRKKGGNISKHQLDFLGHIEALAACGYPVIGRVAQGFQETVIFQKHSPT